MPDWETQLSKPELAALKAIADRDGVSIDSAASRLASEWLARKVKRRTGKAPARVYEIPRPTA